MANELSIDNEWWVKKKRIDSEMTKYSIPLLYLIIITLSIAFTGNITVLCTAITSS